MDNTCDMTAGARANVSAFIRSLLESYNKAETPASRRDVLLQLHAAGKIIALNEPVTHFGTFAEVRELAVSESEMADLLAGYRSNRMQPDEKVYLARIQNCVLREQVIDGPAGAERVLRLMSELQRESDHKLVLM